MSQTEFEYSSDHVLASRLLAVAAYDDNGLTDEEVNHLKDCFVCVQVWKHFIRERIHEKQDRASS